MKNIKVAFIGLGVMGYPMAGHLSNNGYSVCVYNRTTEKAEKWVAQYGGALAHTPAEAAQDCDFVFMCVGNDDDVRSVTLEKGGVLSSMKMGATLVDHTTASANIARELYQIAQQQGVAFLDAPVSGGQAGAENGALTIMVGGEQPVFDKAESILNSYAKMVVRIGDAGSGQLTKMVNQICIAGLVQGLSEATAFAINADLDTKLVFDAISKGASQSWQMDNRAETMVNDEFDFGFAVDWMRKDLSLCFAEATRNNSELPITKIVDDYYAEVQKAGGNRFDTSSLITRLHRKNKPSC